MKLRYLAFLVAIPVAVCAVDGIEAKIRFTEIARKAGIQTMHHTRHFNGKTADVLRMFTSGGSSAAVGDYDGDGFDDLGGSRSVDLDPELDELVYMPDRKGLEATGQLCRFSQRLARVLQLLHVDVKPVSSALQLLVAAAPVLLGRGGW